MWKQASHFIIRSRRVVNRIPLVTEVRSASISTLFTLSQQNKLEYTKKNYINTKQILLNGLKLSSMMPVLNSTFQMSAKKFYSTDLNKQKDKKDLDDDDDDEWKDKAKSTYAKFKLFIRKYGRVALFVHFSIYAVTLTTIYSLLKSGVDVSAWIKHFDFLGLSHESSAVQKGSTLVLAFAATKVTSPVRFGLTFLITPALARQLRKMGLYSPPSANTLTSDAQQKDASANNSSASDQSTSKQ